MPKNICIRNHDVATFVWRILRGGFKGANLVIPVVDIALDKLRGAIFPLTSMT
jgi:uncharacterized protein (DUF1501 family)